MRHSRVRGYHAARNEQQQPNMWPLPRSHRAAWVFVQMLCEAGTRQGVASGRCAGEAESLSEHGIDKEP